MPTLDSVAVKLKSINTENPDGELINEIEENIMFLCSHNSSSGGAIAPTASFSFDPNTADMLIGKIYNLKSANSKEELELTIREMLDLIEQLKAAKQCEV